MQTEVIQRAVNLPTEVLRVEISHAPTVNFAMEQSGVQIGIAACIQYHHGDCGPHKRCSSSESPSDAKVTETLVSSASASIPVVSALNAAASTPARRGWR